MNPLSRIAIRAAALACAGFILSGISTGSALAASCTYTQGSPLFATWGDSSSYTPFQGSTFESGASGWSWGNGAKIVDGDSDGLLSTSGTHAVQVPGGGTARSPWLCVNSATPSMRFFVRRVSGSGNLTVKGLISSGGSQLTSLTTLSGAASAWSPSPIVVFPSAYTATASGENVQIQFVADPGTTFRIDDVELDPYLRN